LHILRIGISIVKRKNEKNGSDRISRAV